LSDTEKPQKRESAPHGSNESPPKAGAVDKCQQPPNKHTSPSELCVGEGAVFGRETKLPLMMCPACDRPLEAAEWKPVGFSNGHIDVTYVCETCPTHTVRTINPHDKALI
jgi:hypothetical protein